MIVFLIPTWCTNSLFSYIYYISLHVSSTVVLIFRRTIVLVQHLVSSLPLGDCSVHRLRQDYRCDDTRGCVMQFWPPDDEHMCSKHVDEWNKLVVKQKFCASSWLITEINVDECTKYIKIKNLCIKLVKKDYRYILMHGQQYMIDFQIFLHFTFEILRLGVF